MINIAQAQRQRLAMVCEQVLNTPGFAPEELVAIRDLMKLLQRVAPEVQTTPQVAPNNKARKSPAK